MAGINRIAEQKKTGELPSVRVLDTDPPPAGFRAKDEIQGWNEYLIRKFLKPDRIREVVHRGENLETKQAIYFQKRLIYEYSDEQIARVEATPEFQKARARAAKKGSVRLRNV